MINARLRNSKTVRTKDATKITKTIKVLEIFLLSFFYHLEWKLLKFYSIVFG